jgi:hypothetical protein
MGLPMTAREQLLLAKESGHQLQVETRGPWPELGDPNPKFYVSCSCGWEGRVVRSAVAMKASLGWHLGKAVADALEQRQEESAARRRAGDRQAGSRVAGAPAGGVLPAGGAAAQ